MTLQLTPDLERRLTEEAQRHGVAPNEYGLQLLDERLPPPSDRRAALIALLQSLRDVDEEGARKQRETGEYLIRVLDEDRTSERKLFPPELKGISW